MGLGFFFSAPRRGSSPFACGWLVHEIWMSSLQACKETASAGVSPISGFRALLGALRLVRDGIGGFA